MPQDLPVILSHFSIHHLSGFFPPEFTRSASSRKTRVPSSSCEKCVRSTHSPTHDPGNTFAHFTSHYLYSFPHLHWGPRRRKRGEQKGKICQELLTATVCFVSLPCWLGMCIMISLVHKRCVAAIWQGICGQKGISTYLFHYFISTICHKNVPTV